VKAMTEMRWWRPGAQSWLSKTLDRRMLEEVGLAVQYVLVNDAAAWGAATKGEEGAETWALPQVKESAEAWALRQVTEELERIMGLVSEGVLGAVTAAIDGLPEEKRFGLKIYATKEEGDTARAADPVEQAWMWPWDRDEGETLCRASMMVIEAAKRIAPDWDGLGKWLPLLAKHGGLAAWKCDKEPSVALEILVAAAADVWRRQSERAKSSVPGVTRAVVRNAVLLLTSGNLAGQSDLSNDSVRAGKGRGKEGKGRGKEGKGRGKAGEGRGKEVGRIVTEGLEGLASMPAQVSRALVQAGLSVFGNLAGNRLVDELARRGAAIMEGFEGLAAQSVRPRVVYDGWAGLGSVVMPGHKGTSDLRAMGAAGAAVHWTGGNGWTGGGLWTCSEKRGSRHFGPGEVAFVLGDAFMSGFALVLPQGKSLTAREARRVIPVLSADPPMGAVRPNEAGAVYGLARLFILELVDRSPELVTHGGIKLTLQDWHKMATMAGVPLKRLKYVLTSWKENESEKAPALILRVGGDMWTLAAPRWKELLFIVDGGHRRITGKEAGLEGSAEKTAEAVKLRRDLKGR